MAIRVKKIKWYHRLWNVIVFPIELILLLTVFFINILLAAPLYVIFGPADVKYYLKFWIGWFLFTALDFTDEEENPEIE